MRRLAAILHTLNDERRIGRCLETLYPCDEILIVDEGSTDQTVRIAREYGASVIGPVNEQLPGGFAQASGAEWVLCLDPRESLTEGLAASLFEWKSHRSSSTDAEAFCVFVREETATGWVEKQEAQPRLVPRNWQEWNGHWPSADGATFALEGQVLRFLFP